MFINRSSKGIFNSLGMLSILLIACLIKENKAGCLNCLIPQELEPYQVYYLYNPDYPQNSVDEEHNYEWDLGAPENYHVFLNCTLNLPNDPDNCFHHKVIVQTNLSKPPVPHCGNKKFTAVSATNKMKLFYQMLYRGEEGNFACSVMATPH
ncbi:uncharacterized protein LOC127285827 [Leptopilina boulardi]|uniref:uncharacterized protein LOC127285827 n=1 Tax=Leptopilina boulardi TaxID=63433 RepID=UPI0021F5564D|nr:uncharacterized protein LOC127285827 [Leptopilina boulardi]